MRMADLKEIGVETGALLTRAGLGRNTIQLKPRRTFFREGDQADCVFFLQSGRARLTVASKSGKEATIALLTAGDFVGEESIASAAGLRMATATAITSCTSLKIQRAEMIQAMREGPRWQTCL